MKMVVTTLLSYVAASIVAVLAMLLWTLDFEIVGAALLVPLFIAPAMVGHALTSLTKRWRPWRRIVFIVLALPMPLCFLWTVLFASPDARADGSDQWALIFLIPTVSASVVAFVVMEWRLRVATAAH